MPGFLYFLPTGKKAITAADLKAAGAGYALAKNESVSSSYTTTGPAGAGCIAVMDGDGLQPIFKPAQLWRKANGGKYWVGVDPAAPPGPADLARERVYDGTAVQLLDGNGWIVPRCCGVLDGRGCTLPRILDLDDDGETTITRPHPRYAKLCDDAFAWWQQWTGCVETKMPSERRIQLAIDALAVNYRVGKPEVIALLKLWGTDECSLVLRALIDADEIESQLNAEKQKKSI